MRTALVAAILLAAATASADPESDPEVVYYRQHQSSSGLWLDVGALWARVDAGTDAAYSGKLVRFAPHASIGRTFYLGGEVDIGTIDGDAPASMTLVRGSSTMPTIPAGITGSLAAIKGVAGARLFAGPISGAAELAAGIHHAAVEDMYGKEVTAVGDRGIVEAHARLDWWATPALTLGALAGVDLFDSTNLVFGVELGVHFTDYDNVRR